MKSVLNPAMLLFVTMLAFAVDAQAIRREPANAFLVPQALGDVGPCEGRPDFISELRPEIVGSFEKLPQIVLVAREAEYYVEAKNSDDTEVKIHSYESFVEKDPVESARIVCAAGKSQESSRFSLFAPTLIDTTVEKRTGQSLWQFQVLVDKEGYAIWNQHSLAFSPNESLEKVMERGGASYRIYRLSDDEYEIVISKNDHGVIQYLSIRYDAVTSL